MSKCNQCRKNNSELDSTWDRVRLFFFNFFHNDIIELSQDRFTQGFADGYKAGWDRVESLRKEAAKDDKSITF